MALRSLFFFALGLTACRSTSSSTDLAPSDGGVADGAPTDGATADGFVPADGSTDGGTDGMTVAPITAAADTWTWIDFPDSRCASGTPTGLGVNLHPGATDLLVYFEGGGACTDADSCWGAMPAARNLGGYDEATFFAAQQLTYPLFDRSLAANPYAAMSFVYVPYCTGDMHAGSTIAHFTVGGMDKPTYYWGANDVDVFLKRLEATFATPQRITLAGTSAGGFATFLVWHHFATAFPGVRIDIVDDSGPAITGKGQTDNSGLFGLWQYLTPTGCAAPCSSFADVLAFDRMAQPNSKFGFLTFARDTTLSTRFHYTLDEYSTQMTSFSASLASDPSAATYIVTNEESHVVESDGSLVPDYMPWMSQMATDDAAWTDQVFMAP